MLFTSLEFLFLFFPLTLGINFLLPKNYRNYWLLLISLFFYAWGEPIFVLVMISSILFNFFIALRIDEEKNYKKLFLVIGIIVNLGLLFAFKYLNFTTGILNNFFPNVEITKIALPIGISFFTFQSMSYVIDVYRGAPVQKNLAYLGLYVSLFPQLIAGPIVRYTTVADEIVSRTVTKEELCKGFARFVRGFNKKVLLANLLSQVADIAFASEELSVSLAWIGAICYTLQIFFDFSGYSEMAIGIGLMLGFHFLENFDYPYISKTITEFWRRWHMSLGSWFRDYLYFPLGGSRVKSKFRLILNLSVVWLATGIWHGASWNFILWGVLYGIILIFEKLLSIPKKADNNLYLRIPYQIFSILMVVLGWVLFRATDLNSAWYFIKSMFGATNNTFTDSITIRYFFDFVVLIIVGIICSTPLISSIRKKLQPKIKNGELIFDSIGYAVQFILFLVSVSYLIMNAHNPFIYFNF